MMLMMFSARMFLGYFSAQAGNLEKKASTEPKKDEMTRADAMGARFAEPAGKSGSGPALCLRANPRERAGTGTLKKSANPGGRRGRALDPARVEWIEARSDHSRVFTPAGSFLVRRTLDDLEKAWLANKIICISPEIMVNARRIRELRSCSPQGCEVVLESGKKFPCAFPFTVPLNQVLQGMQALGLNN